MALKNTFKEKAQWEKSLGKNDYGKDAYAEPVEIKCRFTEKTQLVFTDKGEKMVSLSKVTTIQPVQVGDRINGRVITVIKKIKNGNGKVEALGAYLL